MALELEGPSIALDTQDEKGNRADLTADPKKIAKPIMIARK